MIYHKLIDAKYEFPMIIIVLVCSPHEGFIVNCLALSPLGGGKRLSSSTKLKTWNTSRAQCSAFNLTLMIYLNFKYMKNLQ